MLIRRLKRFFFPSVFNSAHRCANQVKLSREQLIIVLKLNHLSAYFSSPVSCVSVICRLRVGNLSVTCRSLVGQQLINIGPTVGLGYLFVTFTTHRAKVMTGTYKDQCLKRKEKQPILFYYYYHYLFFANQNVPLRHIQSSRKATSYRR